MARQPDAPILHTAVYQVAFLVGDNATMEEQVAWGATKPSLEGWLLPLQSANQPYHGRLASARALTKRGVEIATRTHAIETAADLLADQACREAEIGDAAGARRVADEALAVFPGRDVSIKAGWALARGGDISRAQKLAAELQKEFPSDKYQQSYLVPTIRAAIELGRRNPGKAVDLLRAVSNELGHTPGAFPNLYHIYLRGLAFLQAGDGQSAVAEFQKIIDHPA